MDVFNRDRDVLPFITRDGSTIREILAPNNAPETIRNQSLAEATLLPGRATAPHYHAKTEEIYYLLRGSGEMRIETETCRVGPGDAVAIPPGARHQIVNAGETDLVFLCCCAPAYTHEDTVLVPDVCVPAPVA